MNVLFLTLLDFKTVEENGIYTDLMREFIKSDHNVYIISPTEKRKNEKTHLIYDENCTILKLQIGNIQKTNLIEKGISTFTLEKKYTTAIDKYFRQIKFDLVLYSTPPITLQKAVEYVKKRDNALSYLLLKDIFPQNAVDLGIIKKNGIHRILYSVLRNKEKKLYMTSDYIGCMSEANKVFLLKHNPYLQNERIELCPNSIDPSYTEISESAKEKIREKYKIPNNKTIFIYGGNLGKPQGVDFLIECLESNKKNRDAHFIIVGSGTEYYKLEKYFEVNKLQNAQLFSQMPKTDYEVLANSCDVGLIFLDKRFTIPNFPSRLLSYMQASMPVLATTDVNTDIGEVIEEGQFGYWCESNNVEIFNQKIECFYQKEARDILGKNARQYLENNYTAKHSYEIIMRHFK
ncbi:glycosyltransferase family 4 protein [Planococcus versutus]|uniref:Glycosyltransferase WbuB n=1 Tax=Planococcus versutus TaxID=1302659 RepID=A0A1B1S2Y3_9BACL|nr:glycosyltransferase family 4 protein [Planococcus versutus]ANU27542.1 glycosyltransferase WbuB [Planococcus versutus]